MSYARARQHYRAAQHQTEQMAAFSEGFFITRQKRNKMIATGVVIIIGAFIKGLIIGHMLTRED